MEHMGFENAVINGGLSFGLGPFPAHSFIHAASMWFFLVSLW